MADCVYDVNGIEHSLFCLFVSLVFADVCDVNGIEHSLFCLFVSLVFADVCDVNGIEHSLFCLFVSLAFAEEISRKRYMYQFEVFSLILY